MPTITRFEELEAWPTARELTRIIYALTEEGKFSRDFGLKDQIRRGSVSIMSNIAEGFESHTQTQFIRHLGIVMVSAMKSALSCIFHMILTTSLTRNFLKLLAVAEKASRQIASFISYLETHSQSQKIQEGLATYEV
jgi:four helix bundle protein